MCPKCGYRKTRTKWVRNKKQFTIRSRECPKCSNVFTTKEMSEDGWNWKKRYESLKKSIQNVLDKN